MKLSIITTVYQSSDYIEEFYDRITTCANKLTDDYEIIIVNDGSPDNSLDLAIKLHHQDSKVKVVDLSKNFGHHKALMTGINYATGQYVFLIDSDLDEPPEVLTNYWQQMHGFDGVDVVYGQISERRGSIFEKISGRAFYRVMNFLSGEEMPVDFSASRLMTRRYVDSLKLFTETNLYIGGLWHITGFNQVAVPIRKTSNSVSTYTFKRKFTLAVNAITSFSSMPLNFIFYLGLIITIVSTILGTFFLLKKLLYADVISGWTSLIVTLLFMTGIIQLSIGVIGIYVAKIFLETKNRPSAIIRHEYIAKDD